MAQKSSCDSCRRLRAQLRAVQAQLDALRATVAELRGDLAKARKDSTTSSKPPSSDIVKPSAPHALPPNGSDGEGKRSLGGQPGHPRHERPLVDPALLNGGSHTYVAELCPCCGHGLRPCDTPPRVVQQVEIEDVPIRITEHRAIAGWCAHCERVH